MNKKIQVDGNPNLYRDKYSGAILNCNYEEIRISKLKKAERQRTLNLEEKVEALTKDMDEIKKMLNVLLRENKK
jgi:hypothetical protein